MRALNNHIVSRIRYRRRCAVLSCNSAGQFEFVNKLRACTFLLHFKCPRIRVLQSMHVLTMKSPLFTAAVVLIVAVCQAQGTCNRTVQTIEVDEDSVHQSLVCISDDPSCSRSGSSYNWTRGTDLSDPGGFTPYPDTVCKGFSCVVNSSVYLSKQRPIYCCYARCFVIYIHRPSVNRTVVPQIVRAGREETVYLVVHSKPRPTTFPELTIEFQDGDENNTHHPIDHLSVEHFYSPTKPLEYILIHSFLVPHWATVGRFTYDVPAEYTQPTPNLVLHHGIDVIPAEPEETEAPTTVTATTRTSDETTPETTSSMTVRPPATQGVVSSCIGSSAVVGAAFGSFVAGVLPGVIVSVIFCYLFKRRNKKYQHKPTSTVTPTSLPLGPMANGIHSATPTPINGYTPTSESAVLIIEESGRSRSSGFSVSARNHVFTRLPSRGSNSPTTPSTEDDRLLRPGRSPSATMRSEPSAASAASSRRVVFSTSGALSPTEHVPGAIREEVDHTHPEMKHGQGEEEDDEKNRDYPHIYSVIHDMTQLPPSIRPLPPAPPTDTPTSPTRPPLTYGRVTFSTDNFFHGGSADAESGHYATEGIRMNLPCQQNETFNNEVSV